MARHSETRKKLLSLTDFLTAFFVFSLVTVAFHEYLHATVAKLLGGSAVVHYNFFSGYAVPVGLEGWKLVLTAFAGGVGCFLLFLYFFLWWLEEPNDYYVRLACLYWLGTQLVYGLAEGLKFWIGGIDLQLASILGSLFGVVLVLLFIEKSPKQKPGLRSSRKFL